MNAHAVIYPDSWVRSLIDGVSFLLLLTISLYVPFVTSFNLNLPTQFDSFEVFIDTWFLFEIVTNFFTGFYNRG